MSNLITFKVLSNLIEPKIGILAHDPLLQRRRALRKSIHPHAILPRLPHTPYAHRLLGDDHNLGCIWNMVCS